MSACRLVPLVATMAHQGRLSGKASTGLHAALYLRPVYTLWARLVVRSQPGTVSSWAAVVPPCGVHL